MTHTKIVAPISDLRCDVAFIRPLVEAGVNVVRMNTAHMTKEGITQVINNTRAVSPSVAVLLDTKGPEVRTTVLEGDSEVKREFHAGDKVIFQANPEAKTNNEVINVNYVNFVHDVPVGARILLDDGALAFDVEKKEGDKLFTVCQNNGKLGSRKSVNVPGVRIDLPSLTVATSCTLSPRRSSSSLTLSSVTRRTSRRSRRSSTSTRATSRSSLRSRTRKVSTTSTRSSTLAMVS